MAVKKGLGTGLDVLFGDSSREEEKPQGVLELPIAKVEPRDNQPRTVFDEEALSELAESIREYGVIQPVTVRKLDSGYYQLIAGERRWRAARIAGLTEIPARVIEADDKKAMELALIENLQRSDLNPIEEALGYQELMGTYEMTQEQAAARVGKSRPAVANALRLLSLSPAVLELVKDGSLSAGHARALLPMKDEAQQLSIAQKVMALGLSVRQTEALCKKLTKQAQPVKEQPPQVDYLAECEKELTAGLGRKVRIVSGKRKGRIELEYYGQDDLQQLYDALHTIRKKEQH